MYTQFIMHPFKQNTQITMLDLSKLIEQFGGLVVGTQLHERHQDGRVDAHLQKT
jgi:hypothetical protein